jgi:hypothetical protein
MRVAFTIAAVLACPQTLPAAPASETLSAEGIQQAIEWGRSANDQAVESYVLKVAPTFTVSFDTPYLRVAQLSRKRKMAGQQLDAATVPAGLLEPEIHVYALAVQQPDAKERPRSITHVTLRKPRQLEMVQPLDFRQNVNRSRTRGDFQPAGISRSVEAVFRQRDFSVGSELCLTFEGSDQERIPLTADNVGAVR